MGPNYGTLDWIADAYTPLLAVIALVFIIIALFRSQWRLAGRRLLALAVVLSIAYGLMLLDGRFYLWPALGLDYSTHTAVAMVLVAFLLAEEPRLSVLWFGSLAGYALLMLYQGYHTFSDIAITGLAVIVPAWLVLAYLYDRWPFATDQKSGSA